MKTRQHSIVMYWARKPDYVDHDDRTGKYYFAAGRREEALKLREETLELCRKGLGPEHPTTLAAMKNLAISYHALGRDGGSIFVRGSVAASKQKVFGPEQFRRLAPR